MSQQSKTRIGHVHLKVRDLQRAVDFYLRYFALEIVERIDNAYAFLSAGDGQHALALQAVGGEAPQPSPFATGLYHVAFEVADARIFALTFRRLRIDAIDVQAVDHGAYWAMYFHDPDGNGLGIYCPRAHNGPAAIYDPHDNRLLPEATILAVLG